MDRETKFDILRLLIIASGLETDEKEELIDFVTDYEKAEENGLLIHLPCRVGDTFWELNNVNSEAVIYPRIAHSLSHVVYCIERLGKYTFLSQEEAEQALKQMGE